MSERILVIEDDAFFLQGTLELLEDADYMAEGAMSVPQALALTEEVIFDLVISDIQMPQLDGVEGLIRLREKLPNMKCILMTGQPNKDAPSKAIENQVDDYIRKPFQGSDLLFKVERLLKRQELFAHYIELLQTAPTKLFSAALRLFKRDSGAALDKARVRAFEGFYFSIQSTFVEFRTLTHLYYELEQTEQSYREYLAAPTDEKANALRENYEYLLAELVKYAHTDMQRLQQSPMQGAEFRPLYEAVRNDKINYEDFQLAPTLRTIASSELISSPHLQELRKKMWTLA